MAHIAFAHHAALFIELRNGVGAIPHAVLAADAGIGRMQHDAGHRILGVGIDGATLEAVGVEAMVAAHGKIVAAGIGVGAAFNLANAPPANLRGVSVLLVAGDLAGAAADALRHVEVEAVLLSRLERPVGNEHRGNGGRAAGADASGLRKSSSVRRTSVSLLPSCARSCSGNAMCGPSFATAGPVNQ